MNVYLLNWHLYCIVVWHHILRRYEMARERLITRLNVGQLRLIITHDSIKAIGFQRWHSVGYMRTNESRTRCAHWYAGLVERGIIRPEGPA